MNNIVDLCMEPYGKNLPQNATILAKDGHLQRWPQVMVDSQLKPILLSA